MWVSLPISDAGAEIKLKPYIYKKTKPAVSDAAYRQPRKLNMRPENT